MVCCVIKLLLTLADEEATSLLPNSPSMRTERLHLIQRNFEKRVSIFSFSTQKLSLVFPWHRKAVKRIHFKISKAPSLGSFIFVQYSAGILCPLSFAMEFDTFLFGFWNQLCEHTTHTDLRPWALSPLCLGNHYLKLRIQNKLYGKQIGKKPPTQVI